MSSVDTTTRAYEAVSDEIKAYEAGIRAGRIEGNGLVRWGAALAQALCGELADTPESVAELAARIEEVIDEAAASGNRMAELETLRALKGEGRGIDGHKDVWIHTLRVVCAVPDDLVVRLAALYHDVGKPATRDFEQGRGVHFDGHEVEGSRIVRRVGRRYGWPESLVEAVAGLVRQHLRAHQAEDMSEAGVRRYARDAGISGWQRLGDLTRADCTSGYAERRRAAIERVDRLEAAICEIDRKDARKAVRGPISGYEVMERYDLETGPELGRAVSAVVEAARRAWDEGEELGEVEAWQIVESVLGPTA